MRTVEGRASGVRSPFAATREHLRLMLRIGGMLVHYFTAGRRVRKAYRQCEANGKTYWVDEEL